MIKIVTSFTPLVGWQRFQNCPSWIFHEVLRGGRTGPLQFDLKQKKVQVKDDTEWENTSAGEDSPEQNILGVEVLSSHVLQYAC